MNPTAGSLMRSARRAIRAMALTQRLAGPPYGRSEAELGLAWVASATNLLLGLIRRVFDSTILLPIVLGSGAWSFCRRLGVWAPMAVGSGIAALAFEAKVQTLGCEV